MPPTPLVRDMDAADLARSRRYYTFAKAPTGARALSPRPTFSPDVLPMPNAAIRCIAISELSEAILRHYRRDTYYNTHHRAELLRLMLVCKAFFYPASAILWSRLDSGLNPLLDLLDLVYVNRNLLLAMQERQTEEYGHCHLVATVYLAD